MRINPQYKLREIAGETFLVNQGTPNINLTRIISLNKSARRLYEELYGKEFTVEDAQNILLEIYNVDAETALNDARKWVESLKECNVIED